MSESKRISLFGNEAYGKVQDALTACSLALGAINDMTKSVHQYEYLMGQVLRKGLTDALRGEIARALGYEIRDDLIVGIDDQPMEDDDD